MEDKIYPLAPVDDVLDAFGLPKTKPLLDAVSPRNILGNKLGVPAPGDALEEIVEDIDRSASPGGFDLPKLPGMR